MFSPVWRKHELQKPGFHGVGILEKLIVIPKVTITSTEPGDTVVTIDWDLGFTTASYSFVKTWWAGSISLPKKVGPSSPAGETCFTLTLVGAGSAEKNRRSHVNSRMM